MNSMREQGSTMIIRWHRFLITVIALSGLPAAGMNLLRPYDTLIRPMYNNRFPWQCSVWAEAGILTRSFNNNSHHTNALSIWNQTQDGLAMLDGFGDQTDIGAKRVQVNADDDGVRGHFCASGDLKSLFSGMFAVRSFFRENWSFGVYLPLYSMELTDVCWIDQTKNTTAQDQRVHEFLTNNFFQNVCELGNGLDLGPWKRTGIGDMMFLLEWFRDFAQNKPLLKSVRVNWRLGLSVPTGLRQDVDKVMAISYGNDGAVGLPFAVGLDFTFAFYVRAGFDVNFTQIFGNTRTRRVKTAIDQTDLLFLQKMPVYKDFGLTQQFNLYAQLYKFYKELSFMVGYQYVKHGDDEIALAPGSPYSTTVANSAVSLRDWTLHQIVARLDYEIGAHLNDPIVYPRISLYAQCPFNGKRSTLTGNIGCTIALDF